MSDKKHKPSEDVELVEDLVTCSCTHSLTEHSEDGCTSENCDCEIERSLLIVGKIQAVDELQ